MTQSQVYASAGNAVLDCLCFSSRLCQACISLNIFRDRDRDGEGAREREREREAME